MTKPTEECRFGIRDKTSSPWFDVRGELSSVYHAYIACLNAQDWESLGEFVASDVIHNGRALGLSGYRAMLEQNYIDIPDLHFVVQFLVCDQECLAARLWFDCSPSGRFLGLPINGKHIVFHEHAFYHFKRGSIAEVFSIIDQAEIETQLYAL